jgi:histidinol-phosphatase (PHP family)
MSGDCSVPILDICSSAIRQGITTLCFTEHLDFDPTDCCYQTLDYKRYIYEIGKARDQYAGKLEILCGIEVDFQEKFEQEIQDYLSDKELDYILGSVHYVEGTILENHEKYFPGKNSYEAYAPYFDNTLAAVETGWFDTLAHIDLCKRYGVRYFGEFDYSPFAERIKEILSLVIEKGMSLEINTSGLRQSPNESYPGIDILQLYFSMGGREITVGSDSHRLEDLGRDIEGVIRLAQSTGFDHINTYQ